MIDTEGRRPHAEGLALVQQVVDKIEDICPDIFIAGSIRREMATVKDGELVIKVTPDTERALLVRLDGLVLSGDFDKANYSSTQTPLYRWGSKYRGLQVGGRDGMKVEIFLADSHNFGYIYWLRTGPGKENTDLMTRLSRMSARVRFDEGKAWWAVNQPDGTYRKKAQLSVPNEQVLFTMLGMAYVAPQERTEGMYQRFFKRVADESYLQGLVVSVDKPMQMSMF